MSKHCPNQKREVWSRAISHNHGALQTCNFRHESVNFRDTVCTVTVEVAVISDPEFNYEMKCGGNVNSTADYFSFDPERQKSFHSCSKNKTFVIGRGSGGSRHSSLPPGPAWDKTRTEDTITVCASGRNRPQVRNVSFSHLVFVVTVSST